MKTVRQIGKAVKTTGVKSNELFDSPLKFIIDISKAASVWSMVQQDSVKRFVANKVAHVMIRTKDLQEIICRQNMHFFQNSCKIPPLKMGIPKKIGNSQNENGNSQNENGNSQNENGNSQKKLGIPKTKMGIPKIFWEFPIYFWEFPKIFKNSREFPKVSENSREFPKKTRIPGNSQKTPDQMNVLLDEFLHNLSLCYILTHYTVYFCIPDTKVSIAF